MPLANSLLSSPDEEYRVYPLTLLQCESCTLVQLADLIPPDELFVDYSYLTSCSPPMVDHAKRLVNEVTSCIPLTNRSLVVEIGSNDGYLLQHYNTIPVLGIDPSERAADAAAARDVPTVRAFFNYKLAKELGPQADVIHANNVLAHVPDLNDFVAGLATLLKPSGTIILEVPYLARLIDKTAFDTIYHEHAYYFSLTALSRLFLRHGLGITDAEQIHTHGGSLRLWISHSGVASFKVGSLMANESGTMDFCEFSRRVDSCMRDTRRLLEGMNHAGFGAAAKSTIFLNACGINSSHLACVADDTPTKQGKFIPGTRIPVVSTADWLAGNYSHTMILAWNFAHDIAHRYRTEYRGKFFTWYSGLEVPTA